MAATLDAALSWTYDFMTLDLNPKQYFDLLTRISQLPADFVRPVLDVANRAFKAALRHQEAVRFLALLARLRGYPKAAVLKTAFLALQTIDESRKRRQFFAACRFLAKVISSDDIPQRPTLPFFTVARLLQITDLEALADAFADCIVAIPPTKLPSFHYARAFAAFLRPPLFLANVLPKFERQVLRSGDSFLPVCAPLLPRIDIPVTERSIARALLTAIASKSLPKAPQLFLSSADCFNPDEFFMTAIAFLRTLAVTDIRTAVADTVGKLSSKRVSPGTFQAIISLIRDEKLAPIQAKLIPLLADRADDALDFIEKFGISTETANAICDVLLRCSEKAKVIHLIRPVFNQAPASVARVLVKKGCSIEQAKLPDLLAPTKFPLAKFDVLIAIDRVTEAIDFFLTSPNTFTPLLQQLDAAPFGALLQNLLRTRSIPDDLIARFLRRVKAHPADFDHSLVVLARPQTAVAGDVDLLLDLLKFRRLLVSQVLASIGFDRTQLDFVKATFSAYFAHPMRAEELHLVLCDADIDEEHPTAARLVEMKSEIAHPTSASNLPALKKQVQKLIPKLQQQQKEIKDDIIHSKVSTVLDCVALLTANFESPHSKITSALTASTASLLILRRVPVFARPIRRLMLSALRRIPAFQAAPKLTYRFLKMDPNAFNSLAVAWLIPRGSLTDTVLHLIGPVLPLLLESRDHAKLCDPHAVTQDSDRDLLIPIYLKHARQATEAVPFIVELATDYPAARLGIIFDHLLDTDAVIRECALSCINVCKFDVQLTPLFICQLYVHTRSNPLALDILERLGAPFPSIKDVLDVYTSLFRLNSKDETLTRDIGLSFAELTVESLDVAVKFLISLYHQNNKKTESYNVPIQNNVRLGISWAFSELRPTGPDAIEFITVTALKDIVPAVREHMTQVCEYFIETFDIADIEGLFNRFCEPIKLPPVSSPENNRLRSCLVNLCLKIAGIDRNLGPQLLDYIFAFNIRSPDAELREVCARAISAVAKKNPALIQPLIENLLATRPSLTTVDRAIGFAYGYSALLHAQGVGSLVKGIFDFTDQLSKSKSEADRSVACYLYAGLSFMFGAMIEPSLPKILPRLLAAFGDKTQQVRDAAGLAIESIVKHLTHACVERVLPYALENVENDSTWRVQVAAILLVTAVLKSNPKNIVKYIPNMVKSLSTAMKSAASEVKDAATRAMTMIRTNVTNDAVSELFPFLVAALSNPQRIAIALDRITHLNLTQKLDSSCLSLIVPVVAAGCRSQDMKIKTNSFKVIGHLAEISIASALASFSDTIVDPLLIGISDATPNIRAIAANSLSSIVPCFHPAKFDEIMTRLLREMTEQRSFSERQGNAQAIASLMKTRGIDALHAKLADFVDLAQNSSELSVREGYVSLLGFLSHFFGEEFSGCYHVTIHAVLNACADPNDAIRTVGLRSASLIAKTFSKSSPQLILTPYFECALKENWRHRLCAVNFLKSFVMATTDTTEADDRQMRAIGELMGKLEAAVDEKLLYPALLTLFILAADHVATVATEAMNLWRQTIPSTGQFIHANMGLFLERLRSFTTSDFEVVRSVGAHAMGLACQKVCGEFLNSAMQIIKQDLLSESSATVHGAVLSVQMLVENMDQDGKLDACMLIAPLLSSDWEGVRQQASEAFVAMRNSLGDKGGRQVSSQLVQFVFDKSVAGDDVSQMSGLLEILGYHAMIELCQKIMQRPLDSRRPLVSRELAALAGPSLDAIIAFLSDRMISMSAHPPSEDQGALAVEIAKNVIDVILFDQRLVLAGRLVENMRNQQPQNRHASILIGGYLLRQVSPTFNDIVLSLVRAALY
jgi:hypothetical protein